MQLDLQCISVEFQFREYIILHYGILKIINYFRLKKTNYIVPKPWCREQQFQFIIYRYVQELLSNQWFYFSYLNWMQCFSVNCFMKHYALFSQFLELNIHSPPPIMMNWICCTWSIREGKPCYTNSVTIIVRENPNPWSFYVFKVGNFNVYSNHEKESLVSTNLKQHSKNLKIEE